MNILELMLFYAIPQGDTNPTAHRLLDTFGSLSGVMNASVENLCQVKGVGQHAATLIKLFAAVVRPYLDDANRGGVVLQSTDEICRYLLPKFAGRTVETFYLVCLDGRRRVNYCGILSEGTLDSVPVFVLQIVETVLAVHASFVIMAHNHPSGFALPSRADIDTTREVIRALGPLSVSVVDHIVVSGEDCVSFRDSGFLNR